MEAFALIGTAMGASAAQAGLAGMLATSGAVSAMGAISSSNAQQASFDAQAKQMEFNSTMARNNAQMASEQANTAEEQQRRKFGQIQGQAVAGIAQSGTGFDGSNLDILRQNAVSNELDALTIRYQGQNQAKGLMAQADQDAFGAGVARMNSSSARTAGYMNAGTSLLSAASQYKGYTLKTT